MSIEEASLYSLPFNHVKSEVKPSRDNNKVARTRDNWWKFERNRSSMRSELQEISSYFAVPRVSKWMIYLPMSSEYLPDTSVNVIASEDPYILGIVTSSIHRAWAVAQSSTLKGDTRYTLSTCFLTFPFPQTPPEGLIEDVRSKTLEIQKYRADSMIERGFGITDLYNDYFNEPTSRLYKLHQELDLLVMQAYGLSVESNVLSELLSLNSELIQKEKKGEAISSPFVLA